MPDVEQVWKQALPAVISQVSGRGVWAALNAAKPIVYEDNVLVLGLQVHDTELAGHLRIPATKRLLDVTLTKVLGTPTTVRVIDGTTPADYEVVKRRDAERRRLEEVAVAKMRTEMTSKASWDGVYEQLARRYAAVTNKSLPQNRARFYEESVSIIAEARQEQAQWDELGERNFARCIERLAQYSEVPSTIVAIQILQKAGEL